VSGPKRSTPTIGVAPRSAVPQVHRVAAHLARRFNQICLGILSEVTEPEALTPLEFAMIAAICDQPDLDQRGLARRLAIDAVSAGKLIDKLGTQGLVDRRISTVDRRARVLSLTRRGRSLRDRLRPDLEAANDRILAPLSKSERAAFVEFLVRVLEGNKAYARPGNGRRRPPKRSHPAIHAVRR
jgi:DNA-binding MarR family transcriptional regulator